MTLAAAADPVSYLKAPKGSSGLSPDDLRREAGVLAAIIDGTVQMFTGMSILKEWVAKPLAGDWDAFGRAGDAWQHAGKAVSAVSDNMLAIKPQVSDVWSGQAAVSFFVGQAEIAGKMAIFQPLAHGMKYWFEGLIQLAGWIAKLIMSAIKELSYKVTAALSSLAVPIVGWASQAAWIATIVETIIRWMRKIKEAIELFLKVVKTVKQIIGVIREVLAGLSSMLRLAQAGITAAGGSNTGFGKAVAGAAGGAGAARDVAAMGEGFAKDIGKPISTADDIAGKGKDGAERVGKAIGVEVEE